METEITGVVLAGGESSRMGEDKSLMLVNEQKLIEFSINALKPFCTEVLISSSKNTHQSFSCRKISDQFQKIGPIAGIQSALVNSNTEYVIILPCDSPMVKPEFVQYLISEIDNNTNVIVPRYGLYLEPLFAIYHKKILPIVEDQIKKGKYRLTDLLELCQTKIVDVKDRTCFVNINTPEDFNSFIERKIQKR